MAEIDDWVFESVLQFLKCPVWTTPIHGFIEQHCHEFATGEEENKLVYTDLHKQFSELVDSLLSTFLEELGVSVEAFVEAVRRNADSGADDDTPVSELSNFISEYILALDDFPSFRAMMERKNVEMDLEAMYEYTRYSQAAQEEEMSEEERFLFEMAIRMSMGAAELAFKQVEAEDAELLQALALSIAAEQERLVREQIEEEGEQKQATETEAIKALQEEIRARRVENVERVVREIQASPEKAVKPQPQPSTTTCVPKPSLAPLGARRSAPGAFVAKTATPTAATSTPVVPQPSFEDLKKQAEEKLKVATAAPTKEEVEQRADYFRKQRELLLKSKQAERDAELKKYTKETAPDVIPTANTGGSGAPEVDKNITVALARRFKDDLINETRK
eukprot:GILI01011057.1.p1 GENE.GILI01011057.1~~GILI01011057.1.p1  ORF type:complete len:391 (+),score=116.49 GILI01011057.1:67-1239(+)